MDSKTIYAFLREHHLFNKLSDEELGQILPLFQPIQLHKGEVLYRAGFPGRNFFIIVSGSICLFEEDQPQKIVSSREHFGEEKLEQAALRVQTAQALENTLLVAVNRKGYLAILGAYPLLKRKLRALRKSAQLRAQISFPWLTDEEKIRYLTRKHIILFSRKMVLPVLFLSLAVTAGSILGLTQVIFLPIVGVLFGGWTWWNWVDWRNDFYLVSSERVAWVEKVIWLHDQRKEIPLASVLSANLSTNQLQRIFGYGDVIIRTYTGTMAMPNAAYPQVLLDLILETQRLSHQRDQEIELDQIGETIRTRLEMDRDPVGPQPPPNLPHPPQGMQMTETITPLQEFLNLFRARYEINGVITYRKHKFIFFSKSWWLWLLLALGVSGFLARLVNLVSFFSLAAIGLLISLTLLALGYVFADWANDRFQVTDQQIIDLDRTPFGQETKRSAMLENILSLDYQRRNLLQRLFNFGTVAINVGDIQLDFENVARPKAVQNEIFERYHTAVKKKEQATAQRQREDMVEFLAAYHQENQAGTIPKNEEDVPDS